MAVRNIVRIDEDLCNGCGECVPSCAEGAIQIIDGKARLVGDALCDGLGNCLGDCPEGAITIVEREADEFDEGLVEQHLATLKDEPRDIAPACPPPEPHGPSAGGGCPGSRMMNFGAASEAAGAPGAPGDGTAAGDNAPAGGPPSALRQWPIELHLVPPTAPYYQGADVLLAADCTAFAAGDFHGRFLQGRALAIACPKLDQGQEIYLRKLVSMIDDAQINTLSVLVMEVPCCGGLVRLAGEAAQQAERKVPIKKIVLSIRGEVLGEEWL